METTNNKRPMWVRAGYLAFGVVSYLLFLLTFLQAVGFVGGFWAELGLQDTGFRSIDRGGPASPWPYALMVDALLLTLFAVQHSAMARSGFKRWWTQVVPAPCERSSYVLAASGCLALLFAQWHPIRGPVLWQATEPWLVHTLIAVSFLGWGIVLAATFMLDHFELFGLRQVWNVFRGRAGTDYEFSTPGLYKVVRHPIYLGFVIAFWATPSMTLSHAVFAAATTVYILIGIQLEERDLVRRFGDVYLRYRRAVGMLLPVPVVSRKARKVERRAA